MAFKTVTGITTELDELTSTKCQLVGGQKNLIFYSSGETAKFLRIPNMSDRILRSVNIFTLWNIEPRAGSDYVNKFPLFYLYPHVFLFFFSTLHHSPEFIRIFSYFYQNKKTQLIFTVHKLLVQQKQFKISLMAQLSGEHFDMQLL